jgi:hypothetical protein
MAVSDVQYSRHGGVFNPNFEELLIELKNLSREDTLLPSIYQTNVLHPFANYLFEKGESYFNKLFQSSEDSLNDQEKNIKKAIEEIAEALLQRSNIYKYYSSCFQDLKAFQAVVSTIFDEMLEADLLVLTQHAIAPLAKWGPPLSGPCAYPSSSSAMKEIGVKAGIVNLPLVHQTGGLLVWATLGHEVAGHHFLRSVDGLITELTNAVDRLFKERKESRNPGWSTDDWDILSDYWCACTEETACDVLGTLTIGPSFGISFIGYFRGIRKGKLLTSGSLYSTKPALAKNALILSGENLGQIFLDKVSKDVELKKRDGVLGYQEPKNEKPIKYQRHNSLDKHPVDVLRAFVTIKIARQLDPKSRLIKLIEDEVKKDLGAQEQIEFFQLQGDYNNTKILKSIHVSAKLAIRSANITAGAIANSPMKCLGGKRLSEIFFWKEEDEALTNKIMESIDDPAFERLPDLEEPILERLSDFDGLDIRERPEIIKRKYYARHIVAASVLKAVQPPDNQTLMTSMRHIEVVFNNMKKALLAEFEKNPKWNGQLEQCFIAGASPVAEEEVS